MLFALQANGADETGLHQRCFPGELADIRARKALLRGEEFIADYPIRPEIDDVNFQVILSRFHSSGHVNTERNGPENPKGFSVKSDFGEFLYFAEIESQMLPG